MRLRRIFPVLALVALPAKLSGQESVLPDRTGAIVLLKVLSATKSPRPDPPGLRRDRVVWGVESVLKPPVEPGRLPPQFESTLERSLPSPRRPLGFLSGVDLAAGQRYLFFWKELPAKEALAEAVGRPLAIWAPDDPVLEDVAFAVAIEGEKTEEKARRVLERLSAPGGSRSHVSAALLAVLAVSARGPSRAGLLGLVGSLDDGRFTPEEELVLLGRLQESLVLGSLPQDGVRAYAAACVLLLAREDETPAGPLVRENVGLYKLPWLLGKPAGPAVVAAAGTPATRKAASRAVESMLARGRRPAGTEATLKRVIAALSTTSAPRKVSPESSKRE